MNYRLAVLFAKSEKYPGVGLFDSFSTKNSRCSLVWKISEKFPVLFKQKMRRK